MTEAEWAASDDIRAMLVWLGDRLAPADRRLFACACVRGVWPYLAEGPGREAVEAAERLARGEIGAEDLHRYRVAADAAFSDTCLYGTSTGDHALRAAALAAAPDSVDADHVCSCCEVTRSSQATAGFTVGGAAARAASRRAHADALREVWKFWA